MSLTVDGVWKVGVWATTVWADGVWREGEPPVVVPEAPVFVSGGRRRRSYVELEGKIVEVSGFEEAESLLKKLRKEEKAQEKDRKRIVVLIGKVKGKPESVGLYKAQEKVEVIEQRMDDRAEKIASLYAMILKNMEDEITNDDEEVLLLS